MHGICASNNPSLPEQFMKALSDGAPAWSGFTPGCDSRKEPLASSARGQVSAQRLRAAHPLRCLSADNPFDSTLENKSQTTNCED
jgi:hypothetical protein